MSDGMGRELAYLSSHATNRYFIPNWGISNNEKVSVYMDGVISLPSVSLNISLGRIIDEEGKDKLKQYVGFVRITKQQAIRLRDYLQRYI